MSNEAIELVIDKSDTYQGSKDIYFLPSYRIDQIQFLNDETFIACYIKNTPTEFLNPATLTALSNKLKENAYVEIVIDQPIKLMQKQDERQIRVNALYSGFGNFDVKDQEMIEPSMDVNFTSRVLTFNKIRRPTDSKYQQYYIKPYVSTKKVVSKSKSPDKKRY